MPGNGWNSHKYDLYNQQQHGVELRQVDIKRRIFQGYPSHLLSPLLFIAVMLLLPLLLLKVLQEMKAEYRLAKGMLPINSL